MLIPEKMKFVNKEIMQTFVMGENLVKNAEKFSVKNVFKTEVEKPWQKNNQKNQILTKIRKQNAKKVCAFSLLESAVKDDGRMQSGRRRTFARQGPNTMPGWRATKS